MMYAAYAFAAAAAFFFHIFDAARMPLSATPAARRCLHYPPTAIPRSTSAFIRL